MKSILPVRRNNVKLVTTSLLVFHWLLILFGCAECWTPPPLPHKQSWNKKFEIAFDDVSTTSCNHPNHHHYQPQHQCDNIGIGRRVKDQQQQQPQRMMTTRRSTQLSDTMVAAAKAISTAVATILIFGSILMVPHAMADTGVVTTENSLIMATEEIGTSSTPPIAPVNELPSFLRDYTNLAPLGPRKMTNTVQKSIGLPLDELAQRLTRDLTVGSTGKGGYFLTGDLSFDIFQDDCVFEDPTNRVASLSQYQRALTVLFDPKTSTVDIVSPLTVNDVDGTITGRIRSRGYLKLPWRPYIKSYETCIQYTINKETGLISRQDQSWSISASDALRETFTPSFVNPPPKSTISTTTTGSTESSDVSQLFHLVNGRRPNEYSIEERVEIDDLIKKIVGTSGSISDDQSIVDKQQQQPRGSISSSATSSTTDTTTYDNDILSGTWILVYLQPGPNGEGIDRRIPFPEFDFNDSYQLFSFHDPVQRQQQDIVMDDSGSNSNNNNQNGGGGGGGGGGGRVTNIGQLLGPALYIQVSGTIREVVGDNDDGGGGVRTTSTTSSGPATTTFTPQPRRFEANIEGGKLCLSMPPIPTTTSISSSSSCVVDLPMIQGKGIFDSLYVGERLRIGQNINGGGARVVQVRL